MWPVGSLPCLWHSFPACLPAPALCSGLRSCLGCLPALLTKQVVEVKKSFVGALVRIQAEARVEVSRVVSYSTVGTAPA